MAGSVSGIIFCSAPLRSFQSTGLMLAAATLTFTWPGPGLGSGTSRRTSLSTSPYSVSTTAFMARPPDPERASVCHVIEQPAHHGSNLARTLDAPAEERLAVPDLRRNGGKVHGQALVARGRGSGMSGIHALRRAGELRRGDDLVAGADERPEELV